MKVMWLSNLLRFLNNLEQYSGEEKFIKFSSQKQGEQSLRNFDLSEYRRVINDVAIWIYGGVTKLMEEEVQPLLVPAIIEHEGIGCITGGMEFLIGLMERIRTVLGHVQIPFPEFIHALKNKCFYVPAALFHDHLAKNMMCLCTKVYFL